MRNATFPKPVAEVLATLVEIFRHQRREEVVELLENSNARFGDINYDNWNGGTTTWALRLEVPVSIFASAQPRLAAVEKEIATGLAYLDRLFPNDPVGEVTISPIARSASVVGQRVAPSDIEVRRLWPEGRFRLFLSHVSKHKAAVSKLRDELELHGVAAFVAHEAIKPSLDWQKEIELALKSMHALAALITPDFHASNWTDQEIGWAFGRGFLVVPVRLGADPYGFAGKVQGISGSLDTPAALAIAIVESLLTNPQTHSEMRGALVVAFREANSFVIARAISKIVLEIADFTDEEKVILQKACTENGQIAGAFGVPGAIYRVFGKPPEPKPAEVDNDVPF